MPRFWAEMEAFAGQTVAHTMGELCTVQDTPERPILARIWTESVELIRPDGQLVTTNTSQLSHAQTDGLLPLHTVVIDETGTQWAIESNPKILSVALYQYLVRKVQ